MNRLKKRITALLVAASLLLAVIPSAAAETVPRLAAGSASVYAGNAVSVNVTAQDLESVATMEFTLYYDQEHFTLNSASSGGAFSYADINTNTAGEVRFAGLAADGVNGSATVMTLRFAAKASTAPGTYPLTLAIGEIYDVNGQPVELARANGALTVQEQPSTVLTISFTCSASAGQVAKYDLVTFTYRCSSPKSLAAGVFNVTYDQTLLAYEELAMLSGLDQGNVIYDVNSSQGGRVVLSYATDAAAGAGAMFSVTFKVVTEENTGATVTMTPDQLYTDLGQPLRSSPCSASVVIQQPPVIPDYPDLMITAPADAYTDEIFTVTVSLEEESNVAAADFTIYYDTAQLTVTEEPVSLAAQGQTMMINPNYSNGTVKFSFIAPDGLTAAQDLVEIRFQAAANEEYAATVSASGRGVVDENYQPVVIEYPAATVSMHVAEYTVRFLNHDGSELKSETVSYLSSAHAPDDEPVRGADDSYHYVFTGWDKDYSSVTGDMDVYAEYDAQTHTPGTPSEENISEPTCTETGSYDEVVSCSFCGRELSRTQKTIPATGHAWTDAVYVWSDDNGTVTAFRACGNDHAHDVTETVSTVYGVVTPAGCETDGLGRYTAAFTSDVFETQTKDVAIPAHGHTPGTPVQENRTEPDGTTPGSYDEVVYCTECGKELSRTHRQFFTLAVTDYTSAGDTPAVVSGIANGGEYFGETAFTVSCQLTCLVLCTKDGGATYERLTAAQADGGYAFNVDVDRSGVTVIIVLLGDALLDGDVNTTDINQMKIYIGARRTFTALQILAGDVNGDGEVNTTDVTQIKRYLAEKRTFEW